MKYILIAALCFAFPATANANKVPVSGFYVTAFESGMVDPTHEGRECSPPKKVIGGFCSDPYVAYNVLGILEQDKGIDFAASLSFFNGHTCNVEGFAKKHRKGWTFESTQSDGTECKLEITLDEEAETISFFTPTGNECTDYCGARGTLSGAEFPFSSKQGEPLLSKDDMACITSAESPCAWLNQ